MENHLGQFTEASDGPEGQEQPVWAVGGQGEPYNFGYHLGKFPKASEGPGNVVWPVLMWPQLRQT